MINISDIEDSIKNWLTGILVIAMIVFILHTTWLIVSSLSFINTLSDLIGWIVVIVAIAMALWSFAFFIPFFIGGIIREDL